MNSLFVSEVARAKPISYDNIPLIGGEFDGVRVTLKNCAPIISYRSQQLVDTPVMYRRLDLDDGNGHKTILYISDTLTDMQAFSLLVKGYKLIN